MTVVRSNARGGGEDGVVQDNGARVKEATLVADEELDL
jgi:hypothetical protein